MTWTAKELITWAASQIGVKESPAGSNKVKYWDYYKQATGANFQGQPWCASFVSNGMWEGSLWPKGKDEGRFRYCPSTVNWAKQNGKWRDRLVQPKTGWLVVFANQGVACHIGFVEKVLGKNYIQTIEGNTSVTSNDNGGAVMRRQRKYGYEGSSFYVLGFIEPDFPATSSSGSATTTKYTAAQIAKEIWTKPNFGGWGSGNDRKKKVEAVGVSYDAVQAEISKLSNPTTSKPSTSTSKPSTSATAVPSLSTGTWKTTASALNVRTGPSTKNPRVPYSKLTANAKAHANSDGSLKPGTPMSVVQISKEGSSRVWGKIPSGWVCLWENKKYYAKKA